MNFKLLNRNFAVEKKDFITALIVYSFGLTFFGFIEPTFKQAFDIAFLTSLSGLLSTLVLSGFNKNKIKKQSDTILN